MGVTAKRLAQRQRASEPRSPGQPPKPFYTREEHQEAIQELTKSYELRLGQAAAAPDLEELGALRARVAELEQQLEEATAPAPASTPAPNAPEETLAATKVDEKPADGASASATDTKPDKPGKKNKQG